MYCSRKQASPNGVNDVFVMLELLRASLFNREPNISNIDRVDWDSLMDVSSEQGVLAWVWDGICKLPQEQQPPRIQRINWSMSAQEIWDRYDKQQQLLNKLIDVCNHNDMRLLLLKGISLSQLYPKPKSRPCGDMDVYFFEDFDKFNQVMVAYFEGIEGHHAILYIDGIMVENHSDFLNPNIRGCAKINTYLKSTLNRVSLTQHGYYVLNPIAGLVFLTMHTMKHIYADLFVPIRNVLDISMFLNINRQNLIPQECINQLKNLKLDKGFEVLLYLSEYLLGLSFEEYHQNNIPPRYVSFLQKWLINDFGKPNMAMVEELGLTPYLKQIRNNRKIRRYMLSFKRKFVKEIIANMTGIARAMLHVPSEESLKKHLDIRFRIK